MKRIPALIVFMILILFALPVLANTQYETLRLDREDIQNAISGNIASFKLMDDDRITKKLEIDEEALNYLMQKGAKLSVQTNIMTFTLSPEAFHNQQWQEAAKSGEPLGIRLWVKKGSAAKVSEYFDEWYYNQIGLIRFGISAWELTGEILVAGVKKYELNSFAAPVSVSVKYSATSDTYAVRANTLEMYVLNEEKEKWEYLGGTVDEENRTMSFNTQLPGLYTIFSNQKPQGFSDIKGHWAENDIQFLVLQQVVTPKDSNNKFSPNQEITRAEFAGFLVRLLKIGDGAGANPFNDITAQHPYYREIISAVKAGLVQGVSQNTFAPDKKITREEMAVMMTRALKYKNVTVGINETDLTKFSDAGTVSSWAKEGVSTVSAAGLMNGKGLNSFAPKSFTTKAEAAAILHRLYNKIK
jgi:hypothetical protein